MNSLFLGGYIIILHKFVFRLKVMHLTVLKDKIFLVPLTCQYRISFSLKTVLYNSLYQIWHCLNLNQSKCVIHNNALCFVISVTTMCFYVMWNYIRTAPCCQTTIQYNIKEELLFVFSAECWWAYSKNEELGTFTPKSWSSKNLYHWLKTYSSCCIFAQDSIHP